MQASAADSPPFDCFSTVFDRLCMAALHLFVVFAVSGKKGKQTQNNDTERDHNPCTNTTGVLFFFFFTAKHVSVSTCVIPADRIENSIKKCKCIKSLNNNPEAVMIADKS